jgi:hypothetical protein
MRFGNCRTEEIVGACEGASVPLVTADKLASMLILDRRGANQSPD